MDLFSKAKAAIHTMRFEHFGIAIVELMASGLITIAHNSGIIINL
jgi:alpha-1,2-mannosyltransferase